MLNFAIAESKTKKLNYLLVMPRLVRSIKDSYGFPLGIAYVSSSMKHAGLNVSTLNLNQCDGTVYNLLKEKIETDNINVVMTGGLSAEYTMLRTVLDVVKQIDKNIVICVGGGIISSDPQTSMEALEADFGVIGEGELTGVEFCRTLENGGDFAAVDGLIYKAGKRVDGKLVEEKNEFVITKPRKVIDELDSIPWPDYEGFDMEKYLGATLGTFGFNGTNTLSMISCRSCPFGCTFCFHTVGRKHRARSMDDFFKELDYLISKYKIEGIVLADDLFGVKYSRLVEFCKRIKPYNIKWLGSFRLNQVNPEMLQLLKEANCAIMGFGLESADNRILKSMHKGITIEQANESLKMTYDAGISISACLIIGDIEETLETAHVSFQWWKDHPEYCTTLRLITPYPGSHIYDYACRTGKIKDKVQHLKDGCPQINFSKMTDEELQNFTKETMEAAYKQIKQLSSFDIYNIDGGCIDLKGECSECGATNEWHKVRIFKITFVTCEKCGQQYFPPLDKVIRSNIDNNIRKLIKKYGRIGVWGMTIHAIDLFSSSASLHDKNIFPIDICSSKQHKNFFGKQIFAPNIIAKEDIKTVIISAPNNLGYIESQIETNYKHVTKVIDISDLTGPEDD